MLQSRMVLENMPRLSVKTCALIPVHYLLKSLDDNINVYAEEEIY